MRPLLIAAAALMLAGCGTATSAPAASSAPASSTAPAPTGTPTNAGSIASATPQADSTPGCPTGPPARDAFNNVTDSPGHDGVVGAFVNAWSQPIYIAQQARWTRSSTVWCRLEPGERTGYAWSHGHERRFLIARSLPADGSKGILVSARDEKVGTPYPTVMDYSFAGDSLVDDQSSKRQPGLSEGEEYLANLRNASVKVIRYNDDKRIAREWTGADSWAVNDWARIDFFISDLPQ